MKESCDKHSEGKIDIDASRRRLWYDKARIWLADYDKTTVRPLMLDVVVDEMATLYRAYVQTYEASYFARSSTRASEQESCAWRYKAHAGQVDWLYSEGAPTWLPAGAVIEPLYPMPWVVSATRE